MADQNETTITINPTRQSDLEFEIALTGIDDAEPPSVRFVATSLAESCDYSFSCTRVEGEKHKWKASIPKLANVKEDSLPFRIEVIVDGYFFQPAQGKLVLVSAVAPKPKRMVEVTMLTTTPLEEEAPVEETPDVVVENIAPAVELKEDEELISPPIIEEVAAPAGFNAKAVAEGIIKEKMGGLQRPETPGKLFKRDNSGKAVVAGFDSSDVAKTKASNASRVRDILKSI